MMNQTVSLNALQNIPVTEKTAVLVVGGGPGGMAAAVAAARQNADVLLVEQHGTLGGTATYAEVTPMMPTHRKVEKDGKITFFPFDGPIYREWIDRMHAYFGSDLGEEFRDPQYLSDQSRTISKDIAALAAEDLCLEAGVKLKFDHTLVGTVMDGRNIRCAVFHSKSGFSAIEAEVFVDATGDGDLAAQSGCGFAIGRDTPQSCQPMTLCFKLSHVDKQRLPDWREVNSAYRKAKQAGVLNCPREDVLHFCYFDDDVVHFNTTRVIGLSAISGEERSRAEIEGRRQLRQIFFWLRKTIPGFEKAELRSMGCEIGVRESRRINGIACATREDFLARRRFDDAILRCNYPIDIHNPNGSGTELVYLHPGEFYELPYGCIVPRDADNLLIGCRCVSADQALHASCRVMPTVTSIGQAAGIAAALSLRTGTPPPRLPGQSVRAALRDFGADI